MTKYIKYLLLATLTYCMLMGAILATRDQFAPPAHHPAYSTRFLCRIEPSKTLEGYEVIAYPHPLPGQVLTTPDNGGFEVPCPN